MADDLRRSTTLKILSPSTDFVRVVVRDWLLAAELPAIYHREVHAAMRDGTETGRALRTVFGDLIAEGRREHAEQLAEYDARIAAATTDDERRALTRARTNLKPPIGRVSQKARSLAGPLTDPASRGAGKNCLKIPADEAAAVRAELVQRPERLLTTYRQYVYPDGGATGRCPCWADDSGAERLVHPDLVAVPVSEWPKIWPKHNKGKRAAAAFLARVEKMFDELISRVGTPLSDHAQTFGVPGETRRLAFVETARINASHETQTIAQSELNTMRRAQADSIRREYEPHEEWQLVQCLEREMDDHHAETSHAPKDGFRIVFRHLRCHAQVFAELRRALDKGATTEDLCSIVDDLAAQKLHRFGHIALYKAACHPHYWRLWDSRHQADPDDADAHNWLIKRARYNREATPYRTPQLTVPHFAQHPRRPLYRQQPMNSFRLGNLNLRMRVVEIADCWRSEKTTVSAAFAPNAQLRVDPLTEDTHDLRCLYCVGAGGKRSAYPAVITSLGTRLDLRSAHAQIPAELRNRISHAPSWTPDLVDEVVEALLDVHARKPIPIYFEALLTLKSGKPTDLPLRDYLKEVHKKTPNLAVLHELVTQLQGKAIRGIDSGTANGGGLAIIRFAGPQHPVPDGATAIPIVPGVVTVYVESSEVILLPGEETRKTPEERRLWTLYEQGLSLLRLQADLISAGRQGTGTQAAQCLAERLRKVDLSALREQPDIDHLLETAASVGAFVEAACTLERCIRSVYAFVRREEKRISQARGRRRNPRADETPLLGGKSFRRIKLLEEQIKWLKSFTTRSIVSRFGRVKSGQKHGVNELPHIAFAQLHKTALKDDRVLQIVAASRTSKTQTVAAFTENLSSFRTHFSRNRAQNKLLAIWSHQQLDERHRALSALTGEFYGTVDASFTSRFRALDSAPGIRMERIEDDTVLKYAQEDIDRVPYPLAVGDYYPRRGGKYFVTLDSAGEPIITTAEANAAACVAVRGISPWTERITMTALIVSDGEDTLVYDPEARKCLEPRGQTYGGPVYTLGATLAKHRCTPGKEIKLMRDPAARFFGFGEWVESGAYWRAIEASILRVLHGGRISSAAAE